MTVDQADAIAAVLFEESGYEVEIRREFSVGPPPTPVEVTAAVVVPTDAVSVRPPSRDPGRHDRRRGGCPATRLSRTRPGGLLAMLSVVTWTVQWATPCSQCAPHLLARIDATARTWFA